MWWDEYVSETGSRSRYGKFGDGIWAKVRELGPGGPGFWWLVDYREGIDRRLIIAQSRDRDLESAEISAERASVSYAQKLGRRALVGAPLTSTERNRFRSERLVAKESAADFSAKLLIELYYQLRNDNQDEIARRVENIVQRTALQAFATYSRRVVKFFASNPMGKAAPTTTQQMEALVAALDQLCGSDQFGTPAATIYGRFDEILRELKGHGFVADSSLVRAVRFACHFALVPGFVYQTDAPGWGSGVAMAPTTWLREQEEPYQALFGNKEEYREDLDGLDITFAVEQG